MTPTLLVCVVWVVIGVALGTKCRVLVLIPATAIAFLFACITNHTLLGLVTDLFAGTMFVQGGYLIGVVISTRQPPVAVQDSFNKHDNVRI